MKKIDSPILITLVQISSPDHYALWNALSTETLAGDLRGEFKDLVNVVIYRIQCKNDIEIAISEINKNPPDILGISVEVGSLEWTEQFIGKYKKLEFISNRKPLMVFGNKLPTYFPEYFLDSYRDSIVVIGEGEESLRGIVKHKLLGISLESIPNLMFKIANNEFHKTHRKSPDLNLLTYPPSMDTTSSAIQIGSNVLIQASRGCSWSQCSYCTIRSFRNGCKWQGFPVERVLKNIRDLVSAGATEFEFADDDFIGGFNHVERIYALSDGIEEIKNASGVNITFRIFLIPHTVYRNGRTTENKAIEKLLLRLKEVGLTKIYFGAESGCTSQLQRYRRGYTLSEIENTIRIIRDDLKIDIDAGFVMFDPNLTIEEMFENIKFFKKWNLIKSNQWPFRRLIVNAGSYMHEMLVESENIVNTNINYMSYDYNFLDKRVQQIFSAIEALSEPSKAIFYALKVISKRQFSKGKKDNQTLLAQKYIEENAEIFLEVMEKMYHHFKDNASSDNIKKIIAASHQKLAIIILNIEQDVKNGRIINVNGFLSEQIQNYKKNFSSLFTQGGE
jgi:radical SAM superfamily enzyme YgiQ (UPF0313 family)